MRRTFLGLYRDEWPAAVFIAAILAAFFFILVVISS